MATVPILGRFAIGASQALYLFRRFFLCQATAAMYSVWLLVMIIGFRPTEYLPRLPDWRTFWQAVSRTGTPRAESVLSMCAGNGMSEGCPARPTPVEIPPVGRLQSRLYRGGLYRGDRSMAIPFRREGSYPPGAVNPTRLSRRFASRNAFAIALLPASGRLQSSLAPGGRGLG